MNETRRHCWRRDSVERDHGKEKDGADGAFPTTAVWPGGSVTTRIRSENGTFYDGNSALNNYLHFHFGIVPVLKNRAAHIPRSTKMNTLPQILSNRNGRKVETAAGVRDQSDQSTNNTSDCDLVKKRKITKRTHFRFRTSFCASSAYADLRSREPEKRTHFQADFGFCYLRVLLFKSPSAPCRAEALAQADPRSFGLRPVRSALRVLQRFPTQSNRIKGRGRVGQRKIQS